jgi:hypothetical protein
MRDKLACNELPDQAVGWVLPDQVDQPLCLDCAARVREEAEAAAGEAEAACAAYEAALERLAQEDAQPLSDEARPLLRLGLRPV